MHQLTRTDQLTRQRRACGDELCLLARPPALRVSGPKQVVTWKKWAPMCDLASPGEECVSHQIRDLPTEITHSLYGDYFMLPGLTTGGDLNAPVWKSDKDNVTTYISAYGWANGTYRTRTAWVSATSTLA
jgi:hypothetical protein